MKKLKKYFGVVELTPSAIHQQFASWGVSKYRAKQIYKSLVEEQKLPATRSNVIKMLRGEE